MATIEKNIFRPLLKVENKRAMDPELIEKKPHKVLTFYTDPAWPYLYDMYELLHQVITNVEIDQCGFFKNYIKSKFIEELLQLFDSWQFEERDVLKGIFHKIYLVMIQKRKLMR